MNDVTMSCGCWVCSQSGFFPSEVPVALKGNFLRADSDGVDDGDGLLRNKTDHTMVFF